MTPILYQDTETQFDSNGLGMLSDAISCKVTFEGNGIFELEMEYPITGIHYSEMALRGIIAAPYYPFGGKQPFRIYQITKPISGIVTVYAQHISYDLSGVPVSPFSASSATEAIAKLEQNAAVANKFIFWTDSQAMGEMNVKVPTSTRSLLGGTEGSLLDVYGGEYEFDVWTVKLHSKWGQDSGATIEYGKNLTDLQQEENIANVATGVYPYYTDSDGNVMELPEKIVNAPGTYNFVKIIAVDLSSEFDEMPTEEQLRDRAEKYIDDNKIGVPSVSISVKFFPIEQAEGYENIAPLERMRVFDTATVKYTELGVQATAKCVKSVYDVLKNRYESLELGDIKANIADTIANQQQEIEQLPQSSVFQQAVENATNWITNGQKGEIVAIKRNGKWVEIASLDTGDINTAQSVWRWNNGGFGHSSNGYNGPFTLAMTADGHINASVITTGTLNANIIKAGRLESLNSKAYIDLTTGESAVSRLIGIESDVWVEIGQTSDDRGGEGMFLHKSETLVGQLSVAGGGGGTYPNALWLLSRGALVLQSNSTGYEDAPNRIVMEKDSNGKGVYRFSRGSTSQKMTDFFLANTSTMQLLQDMSSNLDGTSNYGKLAFDANGVLLERTFSADNMVRIWGVKANLSIRWGNGSATTVITLENGRVNIIVNSRSVAEFSDDEISFKTNLNMNGWNIQNSPSVA